LSSQIYDFSKTSIVISSGLFTTINIINKVGLFDEDFFIDFVDIEFCIRAHILKVPVFIANKFTLHHRIGLSDKKFFGLNVLVHSPYRTYFKIRNSFLLFRKNIYVLYSIKQIFASLFFNFFLIFDKNKGKSYLKFYLFGIKDGILNRKGKYRNEQ
jgi:rhamnosyltransferase